MADGCSTDDLSSALMSGQESPGRGGGVSDGEVVALVRDLRAELQAITEGELRRQSRLAAFDQQVAQMEGSIRSEVERLRSTGAAVELQTDLLRQALDGVHGDQGLDGVREELQRLRETLAQLPAPDDRSVLSAVSGLAQQLGGLERSISELSNDETMAAVNARLGAVDERVQRLAIPDLQPVLDRLDHLRSDVAAVPAADLLPVQSAIEALQDRIASIPQPDVDSVHAGIAALRDQVAALPVADDEVVLGAVSELSERVSGIDRSLGSVARRDALDSMAALLSEMRQRVEGLVVPDIEPLVERLDQLHARVAAIPARDLRPLHDQLDEVRALIGAIPAPDDAAVRAEISAVRSDIAALSEPDLDPIHTRLTELHQLVAAAPVVDLDAVHISIAQLRDDIATTPTVDLGPLHARLTDLRERIDATPVADLDPVHIGLAQLRDQVAAIPTAIPVVDLGSIHARLTDLYEQIDALPSADPEAFHADIQRVREQIGAIPTVDLGSIHTRLTDLYEQVDALPRNDLVPVEEALAALRNEIAAMPAVDLGPVQGGLTDLRGQIDALPRPDLTPVEARLDALREQIEAVPPPDDAAVRASVAAVADQLDQLRGAIDGLPQIESVQALAEGVVRLGERVAAIPLHDDAALRTEVTRLTAELDGLRTTVADRFDALPTVDLQPLHDQVDDVRNSLASVPATVREHVAAIPDPSRALEGLATTARSLQTDLAVLSSLAHAIADQTAPISAVSAGLTDAVAAIGALEATTDRSVEAGRESANEQTLALARATAAADGIAAAVGGLRTAISAAVDDARDQTIQELDERLIGRLRATEGRLDVTLEERLRVRFEELTRAVLVDNEAMRSTLTEITGHLDRLVPPDLAPIEAGLDTLVTRLTDLPLPDLGPVAAQLARLSATITSQSRTTPAGEAQVEKLGTALSAGLTRALEQLDHQTGASERIAAVLAEMPTSVEQTETLQEALDRRHDETTRALAALTLELDEIRAVVERRSGRRWRSGTDDAPAVPITALQQTLAEDLQRELDGMRGQLTLLGDRVERALATATAAPGHRPTLRGADTDQADPPPGGTAPGTDAAEKATTKTTKTTKTTTAKTPTAKKTATTPSTAKKTPSKASSNKKAAAKTPTAKKTSTTAHDAPKRAGTTPPQPD